MVKEQTSCFKDLLSFNEQLFKIKPYLIPFLLAFSIGLSSKEEDQSINLIYQKIVALEQEIASLRSLVEENAYLIEKSQELQKQRYMDLDQRLHELKIQSNSEEKKFDAMLSFSSLEHSGLGR